MKHKFSSMGRVAIALVLALSLSLVMAVPVSAAVGVITADRVGYAVEDTASFTITDADGTATETVAYYSTTEGITVDDPDEFTGIDTSTPGGDTYTVSNFPLADTNQNFTLAEDEVTATATTATVTVTAVNPITGEVDVTWTAGGAADTITITYDYYPESHIVDVSSGSATDTIGVSATDAPGTVQVTDGDTLTAAYWDESEVVYQFADTLIDDDLEAPSLDNAVVIGENLVRVEMTDSDPGFDISTIEAADFTVDGEAVSAVDAYNSSGWNPLANTDTAAAILLTTSQTISPGQGVTVAITNASGGIADMVGNAITSGSFDTLGLSVTPSQVALGETVNLEGSITQDGLAYTGTAYWAVIGLSNGGTAVDGDITSGTSPVVLVKGSTASGSFATAMTLDGETGATPAEVVRNYMVLVSTEDVFPAVDALFTTTETYKPTATGEDIINETVSLTYMGTGVLVSAVSGTVSPVGTLIKGDSAIVSGSLTKSDDTGISGYAVDVSAVGESTNPDIDHDVIEALVGTVGSTTTAANGNFAMSSVFDDAGVYAVTYPAYFTDARLLDTTTPADQVYSAVIDTITVGADSLTATTNTATAVHTITTTTGVVLTVEIDDAAPGAGHITRFVLSGVNFDQIVLADTADIIEQVTFSNGDSFGTVSLDMTGLGATLDALAYATAEDYSIITDGTVHITSVVLTSKTDGDDSIAFEVLFSGAGTLSIEGQVEQTNDDADTPEYPDYTGTTSMTVAAPARLNVLPSDTEFGVDLNADGTQESFDLNLQILNEDGNGLQNEDTDETTDDNSVIDDDKEIDSVTVTLTTTGTEFSITGFTATGTGIDEDGFDLSTTGENLTEAVITTDPVDAKWIDAEADEATALQFDALTFEQEGSLTVEVEVLFHDGDTVTETLTYDVSGESASVTPTSAMAGEVKDVKVTVTKDGLGMNTRFVGLVPSASDALSIDADGDGVYEAGEVYDEVWYNPIAEQLEDSGGTKIIDAAPVAGGLYDFGDVKFLKITKVDVQVCKTDHNGELTVFLQDQIDVTGEAVYTLTPDVDSVVAGIANQVDLTVTEDGTQVTGATLDELEGNIVVNQATATPAFSSAVVGDVIRLTVLYPEDVRTDTTLAPVTVSVNTDDLTKTGSLDIAAVEPAVALTIDGVAEAKITRAFIETVSITITDPRDGSEIATADLRVTATNLKLELDSTGDVLSQEPGAGAWAPSYLVNGLLLDGAGAGDTSELDTAENSATYEFDALAYSLDVGETASIILEVSDNSATWIVVATVSIEDATATVSPAEVLLGVQSFISMDVVDAHGQILADGTEAQLSGVVTSTGSLTNGAVSFAVTPSATGTIQAQVWDDTDAWQTLGTVSVVSEVGVTLESIAAEPESVSLAVDGTQQLAVTAAYSDLSEVDVTANATYVSSDGTVATVSAAGVITGVAEGSATVTVTYETETDTISVTVTVTAILDYYRSYSGGAGVVETTDLLKAANDWANAVVPPDFTEPISTTQLLALANEWAATE